MIRTVDPEAIGAVPYILPPDRQSGRTGDRGLGRQGEVGSAGPGESACQTCAAYRPGPQLSGNLQVDPEISLPSPGFGNNRLDIEYFYNGASAANGAFGYGRSISALQTAQASGTSPLVTLTRGNGSQVSYLFNGTSYVAQTPGCLNGLTENGTYWQETDLDGTVSAFPYNTTGQITSLAYMQDSVGNIRTNLYSSGQLQNIQEPGGRLVTLGYSGSLVNYIQDWSNRRTTFLFDATSASPLNLLTTVIGPTGCQTQFQHATFTTYNAGTYGSRWLLSGVVSPNGYGTSYLHDMQGRVTNRIIQGVGGYSYLYQPSYMITIDPLGGILTQSLGNEFSLSAAQNQLGYATTFTRNSNLQETSRQTPDGAIWSTAYTSNGLVSSTETPLGEFTSLTYDSYNNIQTKQTPDGAISTTLWGYAGSSFDTTGAKRRPQVTIDPLGNRVTMGYTAQGLLSFRQDMSGAITTWGYNSFGDQILKQDALSYSWTTTRDLAGNAIAQMNPLGASWSQTFDNMNRPLVATDPLNNQTQAGYDSEGNRTVYITPLGYRTSTTFNVFNLPVQTIDALGNYSTNIFDALGRKTGSVDSLGNISTTLWNAASQQIASQNPLGARWTNTLDGNGRVTAVQNPLGYSSSTLWDLDSRLYVQIDQLGNRSTAIFDVNSRQIANQNPLGFLASTIFDLASRPVAQVDALGNRTSTIWDGRNLPVASVDPLGRTTSTIFNANKAAIAKMDPAGYLATTILDAAGNNVANIDSNGNLASVIRDLANRPIAQINALNYRSSTTYDADSNVVQSIDPLNRISTNVMDALDRIHASISPLGYITTTNRDSDGRTVSIQNASGYLSSTIYNNASLPIATVSPLGFRSTIIRDVANQVIGQQNPLGQIYTNVLDAAGRQVANVSPMGFRTSMVWDGASQNIATIDALGNYATNVFSGNGNKIAEQNRLGYSTSFILDAASQRICVVDANNGRSTTIFTNRGYVSATQNQLGYRTSYTQDPNGNDILRVDARNWATTFTRDALNRVAGKAYIDGTRVTNTWDAAGQQLTSQDVTGSTAYVWDLDGRKTATQNPTGINLTSTLDPLGNRLVLQDNYGSTSYTWDSQSRLLSIWNPYNERTSITWDPLDREQHRVLGNGGTISHTWDSNGRETLIENRNSAGVGQAIFSNTYSATDNRLTVLELDGTRATFSYDSTSQLVSEARGGTMAYARSYVWDALGNRLQQYDSGVLTAGTFNAANQQTLISPASGAPTTRTYDPTGNLTVENTGGVLTTSTWSPENKLVAVVSPSESESYVCSDDGLRKEQTTAAGTVLLTYDEELVLLETTTSGVLEARYTDYPGYFGGLASQNRSGVSSFYGFDTQSSVRILVSTAGVVTDQYSTKAFGEILQPGSGTVNPHVYIGLFRYRLQANGTYLLSVRVLDPDTGAFTSVDPIGFDGGYWNLLVYVNNSPTNYVDPVGQAPNNFSRACQAAVPCAYINSHQIDFPKVDKDAGYTICCSNKKPHSIACFNIHSTNGDNTCIQACTLAHENKHISDYPCPPNCDEKIVFPDDAMLAGQLECRGYEAEIACLQKGAACCNTALKAHPSLVPFCVAQVTARLCRACSLGSGFCKTGGTQLSTSSAAACNKSCQSDSQGGYTGKLK